MKNIILIIILVYSSNTLFSQIDKALVLNGCTDFLAINESDILDYNNELSIEAWVKPNCDDLNRMIISKEWCVGQWSYYFSVKNEKLLWKVSETGGCPGGNSLQSVNAVVPTGVFTHVAVVHSQTEASLFINGVEVASEYIEGSFSNNVHNSNQEFRVGAYKNVSGSFGNYFSGMIDELRVWDIALSGAMIQSNMNTQLSGNENGLILYLDMESNESGSTLSLNNLANISESLVAYSAGFTATTPYCLQNEDYDINPLDIEDFYITCEENITLTIDDTNVKEILWSTGSSSSSITIDTDGDYWVEIETELCKFFTKDFEVNFMEEIVEELDVYVCPEEIYEYQGEILSPNTTTDFTIPAVDGCDTLLSITVLEYPDYTPFLEDDIYTCYSSAELISPFANTMWNNGTTAASIVVENDGEYIAIATDENECIVEDSIVVAFFIPESEITVSICKDDFYEYNGNFYPPNSSETFIVTTIDACDTLVTLNVLQHPPLNESFLGDDISTCQFPVFVSSPFPTTNWSNGYTGGTLEITEEGEYIAEVTDSYGCVHLDTVVIVWEGIADDLSVTICEDEFYPFNGDLLPPNSTSEYLLPSNDGCDTLLTITVLPFPNLNQSFLGDDIISCNITATINSPFSNTSWDNGTNGSILETESPGQYIAFANDANGCFISDTINVVFDVFNDDLTVMICEDEFYEFDGNYLPPNSTETFFISNPDDCDTILTLNVLQFSELDDTFLGDDIITCQFPVYALSPYTNTSWNTGYTGDVLEIMEEGLFIAEAEDSNGCMIIDSIQITWEGITDELLVTICEGDVYPFNGDFLAPNTTSTYQLTSTAGCDTLLTLSVLSFPTSNFLGDDIASCSLMEVINSPFPNTNWSTGFTGQVLEVENSGEYIGTATDQNGCVVSDTILVVLDQITEEISVTICEDEYYEFNGNFLPPNSNETFILPGLNDCDTLYTINIMQYPIASNSFLGDDFVTCQFPITISSTIQNTSWNTGYTGQNLEIGEPGIYIAESQNIHGCSIKDSIEVTWEAIENEITVTICEDDVYPFNGDLLSPNSTSEYLLSSQVGCDTLLTINVSSFPKSDFLGEDIATCDTIVEISSSFANTNWNTGFTGQVLEVVNAGEYIGTATDLNGCLVSDTILVSFENVAEEITVTICEGDVFEFNGQYLTPNSSEIFIIPGMNDCDTVYTINVLQHNNTSVTFLEDDIVTCEFPITISSSVANTHWSTNYTGQSIEVLEPGMYTAETQDGNGCTIVDSVFVAWEGIEDEINVSICENDVYSFGSIDLLPNSTSTYQLTGENGCDTLLTINVLQFPISNSDFLGEDIVSCTSSTILESPYENTIWNNDFVGNLFEVDQEGEYIASSLDDNGCEVIDTIHIMYELIEKEIDISICEGENYMFQGEILPPNSSTNFVISSDSDNSCDTSILINVFEEDAVRIFDIENISTCQNSIILSSPFDLTEWSDGQSGREITVTKDGLYTAEIFSENDCLIKDSIYVDFSNSAVYLPNIISKNSLVNNCFKPVFSDENVHSYSLKVFDRWGEILFNDSGTDIEWCGFYNNQKVVSGVYAFILETEACGSTIKKIGTITVI